MSAADDEVDTSQQAGVGPLNYDELPGLEDILLEDSLVREIVESPSSLRFVLAAALKRAHPFYQRPRAGDRHCYRPATLTFHGAQIVWSKKTTLRFTDAAAAVDLGNIDTFVAPPEGGYHLEGDFGVVDVRRSRAPVFTVLGAAPEERAYLREAISAWVAHRPPTLERPAGMAGADEGRDGVEHGHLHPHGHHHHHRH